MALTDRRYRQRLTGSVVLVLLAVIFLPMLFDREDLPVQVQVDVPPRPAMPQMRALAEPEIVVPEPSEPALELVDGVFDPEQHLDVDGAPITWAVLVARLPEGEAIVLRDRLASEGLDAFIRPEEHWMAVHIGPFLDLETAEQHLDRMAREGELNPILVRYLPMPIGG